MLDGPKTTQQNHLRRLNEIVEVMEDHAPQPVTPATIVDAIGQSKLVTPFLYWLAEKGLVEIVKVPLGTSSTTINGYALADSCNPEALEVLCANPTETT